MTKTFSAGRLRFALATALAAFFATASPALAAERLIDTTVSATPSQGSCTDGLVANAAKQRFTSPGTGQITARLSGGSGDWDLAIISPKGPTVAGSAYPGSDEVAGGYALAGETLIVQACRLAGAAGDPSLTVDLAPIDASGKISAPAMLRVPLDSQSDFTSLEKTGVDITHNVRPGEFADVVAYSPEDKDALTRVGLSYSTLVKNLTRQDQQARRSELASPEGPRALGAAAGLPSGRTGTYRRLFDYSAELKAFADKYPKYVRLFTLPEETYEGRPVQGIEITKRAGVQNGKPTFAQFGVHHAREWPSGEHAIEWAYELLNGLDAGDPEATRLVNKTRTIVVPIVNPDGFNASREAGEINGAGGGRFSDGENIETANVVAFINEYRRKNCRNFDDSEGGNCAQPSVGLKGVGVDPNRNYGGFWGGPGASSDGTDPDYRGPGPFSEPETRNIQSLFSNNVINLFLTNHTYTGLMLHPPALQSAGEPIDAKLFNTLGRRMTRENGYSNEASYELYDTSGGTEDWAYYSTGAMGYTPEIGNLGFHPFYAEGVIAEWNGTAELASQSMRGGGNVAAYYHAANQVLKKPTIAEIHGKGPRKGKIVIKKKFKTSTSPVLDTDGGTPGEIQKFDDSLRYVARVRQRGNYRFALNPSTRPVVALDKGRVPTGPPSDPIQFNGGPEGATPCADAETTDPGCYNDHPIVIPDEPGRDNDSALIRLQWGSEGSDWDMKVFRDSNGDGSSEGETEQVGASGQGPTNFEQSTIAFIKPGEKYVARVTNFAATEPYTGTVTFMGPTEFNKAKKERWTIVCKNRKNKVFGKRKLYIERGDIRKLNLRRC